ncbi:MAG: lysoplasmalogenase [Thermoanaerobaculales bacterium]|nr:lysoplasmalogenase [Thermoanaerobaculales bacterium]
MLTTVVLASIMAGAVVSLLHAIRVEDRTQEVMSKTAASATFVLLGALRWSSGDTVGGWIVAGLALCAVGDVLLLGDRSFDIGLVVFLLGHVFYIAAFHAALPIDRWSLPVLAPLLIVSGSAARWLWPHLGHRRISVLAYVVVISVMVWGGVSAFAKSALPWTAAVGAILFYLSDLAVARHRFVQKSFINRALGLPIYYLGQLLLALTVGT